MYVGDGKEYWIKHIGMYDWSTRNSPNLGLIPGPHGFRLLRNAVTGHTIFYSNSSETNTLLNIINIILCFNNSISKLNGCYFVRCSDKKTLPFLVRKYGGWFYTLQFYCIILSFWKYWLYIRQNVMMMHIDL